MSSSRSSTVRPGTAINRYGDSVGKNTRILRDLTVKLSSLYQDEYIEAANKLSKWLVSEKAYYQEVRPQIVTILETAAYTLAGLLGLRLVNDFHISRCTPDLQPRAVAFTALVQAVKPYLPLFPEEHLKSRLVNVFAMIYVSPPELQTAPGTSSALMRGLSEGASAAIVRAMVESSSKTTPVLPTMGVPTSTSPDSANAYNTHIDQLADQYTVRRVSLDAVQPSPSHDYFAAMARSTSPSPDLPDCPIMSRLESTQSSTPVSPIDHMHLTISSVFRLRKALFPGQDTHSEHAPPITGLVKMQPIRSANPTSFPTASSVSRHPPPEPTFTSDSHMVPSSSRPIIHERQESSSLQLDAIRARSLAATSRPVESVARLGRASSPPGTGWFTTQPQAVFKEEVQKEQDQGREQQYSNNIATRGVSVASPEEMNAPASSVLIDYERDGVSPSVGSTTQETSSSYQPSSLATGSTDDVRPVVTSRPIVERVAVPASEPTGETSQHARVKTRPVPVQQMPGVAGDHARDVSTSELPAEKVCLRQPLSPNLEASKRGKGVVDQQEASALHDMGHTSIEEMLASSAAADTNARQANATSSHTPRSELNVTMGRIPQNQTGQGASLERLDTNNESKVEAGEVERVAIAGDEMGRPASVTAPLRVAELQTVDGRAASHVYVDGAAHHPPSAEETMKGSGACAPVESTPSVCDVIGGPVPNMLTQHLCDASQLSRLPAQEEDPTHTSSPCVLQASHADPTTSVSQNPDTPSLANMAHILATSVPAIITGSGDTNAHADTNTDAHQDAPNTIRKNMQDLEAIGKAGINELTRVDSVSLQAFHGTLPVPEVVDHKEERTDDANEEDKEEEDPLLEEAGLQREVGTPDHQRSEDKGDGEGVSGEKVAANDPWSGHAKNKDGPADVETVTSEPDRNPERDPVQERRVGEELVGGSSTKRARSPSSDRAVSEHPSNKARRDGQGRVEREASLEPGEIIDVSPEEQTELGEEREDVDSDEPLTSNVGHPIHKEGVPVENAPSGVEATENVPALEDPSESEPTSRADLFALPLSSYHPSQPYSTIAVVTGSPAAGTQNVRFELDEEQAMLVKRWTDRYEGLECGTPCISITLICTHVADHQPPREVEGVSGTDAMHNAIRWPSGGKFWVTVEADDRAPVSISVSPPDWIAAHEPLDVSSLVGRRRTTMRFTQTADHASYRFVLRAHRPTAAQLSALDGAALAERTFKAGFGAPLPAIWRSGLFSPSSAK